MKTIRFANGPEEEDWQAIEVPDDARISLAYTILRVYKGKKCIAAFKATTYYQETLVKITQKPIKQRVCYRCKEPMASDDGGMSWYCSIRCVEGTRRVRPVEGEERPWETNLGESTESQGDEMITRTRGEQLEETTI